MEIGGGGDTKEAAEAGLARLTLDQLHDDVDGLLLGAHADEPHHVGVLVLLQNPAAQTIIRSSVS